MGRKFNDFALALSGGGVRGFMHAGFLQALDENGLKPAAISGTSMGAIVGSLYASGLKPDRIVEAIHRPEIRKLPAFLGLKGGLGSTEMLRLQLKDYLQLLQIEDLEIPLIISVTNLNRGCNELIRKGLLIDWVVASSAIPIVFQPVFINNQYYVDGGLTVNLPSVCLRKAGRMIIGLNSNHLNEVNDEFKTIRSVGERCLYIAVQNTLRDQIDACDIVITSEIVSNYKIYDFEHAQAIFNQGYKIGSEWVPQIKESLN